MILSFSIILLIRFFFLFMGIYIYQQERDKTNHKFKSHPKLFQAGQTHLKMAGVVYLAESTVSSSTGASSLNTLNYLTPQIPHEF